jgi:hypothetical protein
VPGRTPGQRPQSPKLAQPHWRPARRARTSCCSRRERVDPAWEGCAEIRRLGHEKPEHSCSAAINGRDLQWKGQGFLSSPSGDEAAKEGARRKRSVRWRRMRCREARTRAVQTAEACSKLSLFSTPMPPSSSTLGKFRYAVRLSRPCRPSESGTPTTSCGRPVVALSLTRPTRVYVLMVTVPVEAPTTFVPVTVNT